MLAGENEVSRPIVLTLDHRIDAWLLLAMLVERGALITAKPDAPPEPEIAKILERIAPPVCASDFQFSEPRQARSKSKHERKRARGWL